MKKKLISSLLVILFIMTNLVVLALPVTECTYTTDCQKGGSVSCTSKKDDCAWIYDANYNKIGVKCDGIEKKC